MDAATPVASGTNPPSTESTGFLSRIKNSSRRTKILIALVVVILAVLVFLLMQKQSENQESIATVGGTSIPRAYLNIELDYYPGTPSAELDKFLTQKVIDDQVTLLAGKQQGIIQDFPEGASISNDDYLKRTALVKTIKDAVNKESAGIEVEVVSIWFFNGIFAPIGYQEGRQVAQRKITALYDRVKSNQITMKQAGEEIAADSSLAGLDKSYKENAYTVIKRKADEPLTFWKEFDDMLWKLESNQLTPIYLASETDAGDKSFPALYAFGKLSSKIVDAAALNYADWLAEQKKNYEIQF